MNSILSHGKMSTELPSKVPGTGVTCQDCVWCAFFFCPKEHFHEQWVLETCLVDNGVFRNLGF